VGAILRYADEVTKAMAMLASDPRTIFVGQAVEYDGQRLHATLKDVDHYKRIEMPVCEDFQMGFCTGLSLEGYIPVSIYPRWDFLILAANQLVNHLDKIPMLGGFKPKVIVRTAVGSTTPLNPGLQHIQDHSDAFGLMLQSIPVLQITCAEDVYETYETALRIPGSCVVVEYMEMYK
jgi:pyruvate/2-oxoglutarate/acetoin dehydrogenase E1 component